MTTERNITELPSGNFRVRIEHGTNVLGGTFSTLAEAVTVRDALRLQLADGDVAPLGGATLSTLTPGFLATRLKNRSYDDDQGRWYLHIRAAAAFAHRPVAAMDRHDILRWLEELRNKETSYDPEKHGARSTKKISWQMRKHCLNLLRRFFAWAIDKGHAGANPCIGIKVEREDGDEDEGFQDTWYLDAAEQGRLLELAPEPERWILAFAMGTGLRQGEQWALHLDDVHVDDEEEPHIVVRFGSYDSVKDRYRSTKGKKGETRARRVPLFGLSLEAATRWLELLPAYAPKNPHGLLFPWPTGARRSKKPPACWLAVSKAFGKVRRIGRKPWWHLLRHTCASSLVSGWWGARWSLEDVKAVLGHSDIKTTQRYAHLAPQALQDQATVAHGAWEAAQASRHAAVTAGKKGAPKVLVLPSAPERIRTSDLRLRRPGDSPLTKADHARRDAAVTAIRRALESVAAQDPLALALATTAMGLALEALLVGDAADEAAS